MDEREANVEGDGGRIIHSQELEAPQGGTSLRKNRPSGSIPVGRNHRFYGEKKGKCGGAVINQ